MDRLCRPPTPVKCIDAVSSSRSSYVEYSDAMRAFTKRHGVAILILLAMTGYFTAWPALNGDIVMSASFQDNFRPYRDGKRAWKSAPSWMNEVGANLNPVQAEFGAWAASLSQHDVFLSVYPAHFAAHRSFRSGVWPLWDESVMAGSPLLANTMTQPLSPFFWVSFVASMWTGFMWMLFAQVFSCALAFYIFFIYRKHSPAAAVIGAFAVTFSPYLLYFLPYGSVVGGFAFVPLSLYCIEKLFSEEVRNSKGKLVALLALAFAGQLLATNLQLALYQLVFEALYAVSLAAGSYNRGGFRWNSIALSFVALAVGVLIASGHLVPTFELLEQSGRDPVKYVGRNFLDPALLLTAFAPFWLGTPASNQYAGGLLFFLPPSSALVLAFGTSVWFFALVGVCVRHATRLSLSMLLVGLPLLMVLIGVPFVQQCLESFPIFASTHVLRLTTLSALAAGLLAPRGFDLLFRGEASPALRRRLFLFVTIVFVVIITVTFFLSFQNPVIARYMHRSDTPFSYGIAIGSAVVVILSALFWVRHRFKWVHASTAAALVVVVEIVLIVGGRLTYIPQEELYPETPLTNALIELVDQRSGRIVGKTERDTYPKFHGDNLPPNVASVYGLHDARGFVPLPTLYQETAMALAENMDSPEHFTAATHLTDLTSPWLSRLGVRYAVSEQEAPSAGFRRVYEGPPHVDENVSTWPLVSFVNCVADVGIDEIELAKRATNGPLSGLLFGRDGAETLQRLGLVFPKCDDRIFSPQAIEYENPSPGHIVAKVVGSERGLVRIAQSYVPGFEATLDGAPLPVMRADFGLQAVPVPHGGVLDIRYNPASWALGIRLTQAGLVALLGMFLIAWQSSRLRAA